jgi:alpha-mannosidase
MSSRDYEDFTGKNIIKTAVDILKQEEEFCFTIDHLSSLESFTERYPDESDYLRGEIRKGRVEIVGPMYTQADSLTIGGESLIRQCLYGAKWLKNLWGARPSVEWLTDVYGYCNQIPQILRKAGVEYLVVSIWWVLFHNEGREYLDRLAPVFDFIWKGIDGSRVVVHNSFDYWGLLLPGDGHISRCPCPHCGAHDRGKKNELILSPDAYEKTRQAFTGTYELAKVKNLPSQYSVFMHMGGDFREPHRENIALIKRLSKEEGLPEIILSTPISYLQTLKRNSLPVVTGEINPVYQGRFGEGYFETKVWIKQLNRRFEYEMARAEFLASMAYYLGKEYPSEKIENAYRSLLFYQHHDPLIGNIPKDEYDLLLEKWKLSIKEAESIIRCSLDYLLRQTETVPDGTPLAVFNTNSWARSDIVETTEEIHQGSTGFKVKNSRGQALPVQVEVVDGHTDKTVHRTKLSILARDIPACGYEVLRIFAYNKRASIEKGVAIKKKSGIYYIENDFYRIEVNQKGQIQGFYDKGIGREIIRRDGFRGNEFILEEDLGCFCHVKLSGKTWSEELNAEACLGEQGPLFSKLICETRTGDIILRKVLTFYSFKKRIDFHVTVHLLDGEDKRLKVIFPLDPEEGKIMAETPFGFAERNEGISSMINWVDYTGEGMGLTVFNCGIPSYEVAKGNIYLNLIKGLSVKDPMKGCLPPALRKEMIEKGDFEFKYAIQSHGEEPDIKEMVKTGYEFNMPLLVSTFPEHQGRLPAKFSFVSLNPENLVIYTIKKAETGKALIARIYEIQGKPRNVARLRTSLPVESCSICNLLETDERVLEAKNHRVEFTVKGNEIITIKLNRGDERRSTHWRVSRR